VACPAVLLDPLAFCSRPRCSISRNFGVWKECRSLLSDCVHSPRCLLFLFCFLCLSAHMASHNLTCSTACSDVLVATRCIHTRTTCVLQLIAVSSQAACARSTSGGLTIVYIYATELLLNASIVYVLRVYLFGIDGGRLQPVLWPRGLQLAS